MRTCVERRAGEGDHTVAEEMKEVRVKGRHRLKVKNNKGEWVEAVLELRYRRIRVLPSRAKKKQCPALTLTVLYARGTRHAQRPGENRLEIDYRLAGAFTSRGHREVGLVRVALED